MTDVLQHFRDRGALLEGHFILSSGLHSPKYLQCALALQRPEDAVRFGEAIAHLVGTGSSSDRGFEFAESTNAPIAAAPGSGFYTVASPAIGGLVIGFAVAQALGKRFVWTERQNGEMTLRRGFEISEGERILVVEDVITTGGSTRECMDALRENGAEIVSAASIIDRSNGTADVVVGRVSLVNLAVPSYLPEECPMCAAGVEAVKPGSRASK